jgi:hypothetical protein
MKQCSKCKEYKDVSCFGSDKRNNSGLQSQCKDCKRAYEQANKDRISAQVKAYRTRNTDKLRARDKKKYHDNLEVSRKKSRDAMRKRRADGKIDAEKKKQYARERYRLDPERHRAYNRHYQQDNLEQRQQTMARYRERNKEKIRAYAKENRHQGKAARSRRRARLRSAGGSFAARQWRDLCIAYDHRCLCCGKAEPEIKLTPDHVIPLVHGGSNAITNIQPLCLICNLRKGTKTIDYRVGTLKCHEQLAMDL